MAAKGNAVVLVAGTLFVGYLYLTGRLQRIIQVLAEPAPGADQQPRATTTPGSYTPQGSGGLGIPKAPWQGGVRVPTSGPPGGSWTPRWWPGSENQRRQDTANPVPADAGYRP